MAINIKKFKQDKTAKPFEVDGVTFYLKPLSQSHLIVFTSKAVNQSPDMFGYDVKYNYANTHVEGWEGLEYDEGGEVEYSKSNCIELLTDDDYEGLFAVLYNRSYEMAKEFDSSKKEDSKQAKK